MPILRRKLIKHRERAYWISERRGRPISDDNWYPIRIRIRWDVDYAQSMIMYGVTYENAKEFDELAYHYTTNYVGADKVAS